MWTTEKAIELCKIIEAISPEFGLHVALTGGLLYKDGPRKDCDILLYRIRQVSEPNWDGLWSALVDVGVFLDADFGWCKKAKWNGLEVDIFDPDESGKYPL